MRQYCVTEISFFLFLALSILNPSPVSVIPFPPSGGHYHIRNVPVIWDRDDIVSDYDPECRRDWHSYAWEVVIAVHMQAREGCLVAQKGVLPRLH